MSCGEWNVNFGRIYTNSKLYNCICIIFYYFGVCLILDWVWQFCLRPPWKKMYGTTVTLTPGAKAATTHTSPTPVAAASGTTNHMYMCYSLEGLLYLIQQSTGTCVSHKKGCCIWYKRTTGSCVSQKKGWCIWYNESQVLVFLQRRAVVCGITNHRYLCFS